ncbi:uncharacterized protein LOC143363084 [Halictus rubicundus]|uniref:uncharacterized protein LOC143363084 n=1 Tax=Halictus rubicundus TaxID=77578 RepID=UPI00403557C0
MGPPAPVDRPKLRPRRGTLGHDGPIGEEDRVSVTSARSVTSAGSAVPSTSGVGSKRPLTPSPGRASPTPSDKRDRLDGEVTFSRLPSVEVRGMLPGQLTALLVGLARENREMAERSRNLKGTFVKGFRDSSDLIEVVANEIDRRGFPVGIPASRSKMELSVEELLAKQSELGRKISRITENFKKSIAQSKMTAGDVQSRLQRLEDYWSAFQRNHDVLTLRHRDTIKGSDYMKQEFADAVEEAYMEQRGRLLDLARQFSEVGAQSRAKAPSSASETKEGENAGSAPLPRMQLPEFHGEYVEWPAFKDLFTSIVDRNPQLSKVDRLHYLKVSLRGAAADLVKDLATTNENYNRAWTILKEQYENKRILVRSCLDRLASLPKMRESSAREIANIHQGISSVVNTLDGLGRPINKSEDWFVYSVVRLFDSVTREKWEERVTSSNDPPSFDTLRDFLTKRRQQLEASPEAASVKPALGISRNQGRSSEHRQNFGESAGKGTTKSVRAHHAQKGQKTTCAKCSKEHYLMQCPEYKALLPAERRGQVEKLHLCYNCLGKHALAACPSTKSCMTCGEKHHSSLHDAYRDSLSMSKTAHLTLDCRNSAGKVLLATAMVQVADKFGRRHVVRALIDQGSEVSMMTEALAQRLQLPRTTSLVDIFGVGGQQLARARGRINLDISSSRGDTIKVSAILLPKLTGYVHSSLAQPRSWKHLQGLELADPLPAKASPIEVLLGADAYPAIVLEGVRKDAPDEPIGQLTVFGWIITGMAGTTTASLHAQVHQAIVGEPLSTLVRRFWEQEELQDAHTTLTAEERECEDHYAATHSRTPEGRYQVRLPFQKAGVISSGSRTAAWRALRRMEQRFEREEDFRRLYGDFLREYETLGHMSPAGEPPAGQAAHYLPHHGVLKPTSTTTKLRVVFNGSWSSPAQLSLNDCLHVGPNLLPLLADTLLRS